MPKHSQNPGSQSARYWIIPNDGIGIDLRALDTAEIAELAERRAVSRTYPGRRRFDVPSYPFDRSPR